MLLTNVLFAIMMFVKFAKKLMHFCRERDLMARATEGNISTEFDHGLWLLKNCSFSVSAGYNMVA